MLKGLLSKLFSHPNQTDESLLPPTQTSVVPPQPNQTGGHDTYQQFTVPSVLQHPPGIMAFEHFEQMTEKDQEKYFRLYKATEEKASKIADRFYKLSDDSARRDYSDGRIKKLERALELLPLFIQVQMWEFGDIPPRIVCRDELIDLYKLKGRWDDAERVIMFCFTAGAFPDGIDGELAELKKYKNASAIATQYVGEHPGVLQKDLYKLLDGTGADREMLKKFTARSLQIRKEKSGSSNKLYLAQNLKPE